MGIKCICGIGLFVLWGCWPLSGTAEGLPVKVVLLAGQSNMSGCGNFDELDADSLARVARAAERVKVSRCGAAPVPLSAARSRWLQNKYGFENSFGPELFAGVVLAEAFPDSEFLLIKTSEGGTSLYGAWNPDWAAEKARAVEKEGRKQTIRLYEEFLSHIKSNLLRLEQAGKTWTLCGVCWMQGENDAAWEVSAQAYEDSLRNLIGRFRSDLDCRELPFVFGQINSTYGKFPGGPERVRAAMAKIDEAVMNTVMIPTSTDSAWNDYPKHHDGTRCNTEGQTRLGKAMGRQLGMFMQLPPRNKPGANSDLELIRRERESRDLEKVRVVFLGDSITARWTRSAANGLRLWDKHFGSEPFHALNLGVRGDQTGHVLYRIDELGHLDGLQPGWVVLHVGVNNISWGGQSADQTVTGIFAVVQRVREKLPLADILVVGLLEAKPAALRINRRLAAAAGCKGFQYLDPGSDFLNPDGSSNRQLFAQGPHPNEAGYAVLARRILAALSDRGPRAGPGVGKSTAPAECKIHK